jgi:enolase
MFRKNPTKIKKVKGREILDSRGNPTVEVLIETEGIWVSAAVPSGASTGSNEAVELRDGGERYHGKGVMRAVKNINEFIAPALVGKDAKNQKEIDDLMIGLDGTDNKGKLGANAMCGVSLATARAAAVAQNQPLYYYIAGLARNPAIKLPKAGFNIINGGAHAGSELDVQEFMLVPQSAKFSDNLRVASEIYHELKSLLMKKYGRLSGNLGDEGGFAPSISAADEALGLIMEAATNRKYADQVKIVLDVAATQFYKDNSYQMKIGNFSGAALGDYYKQLIAKYPIEGIEDPFAEADYPSWSAFKPEVIVIGDDLLVTNPKMMKIAKEKEACNAMILKINQIGTISESLEAAKLARSYGWKIMVSHRSGETNDDFIADFACGIGADYIKTGAPARGERLAKYNRLAKIEEELNEK